MGISDLTGVECFTALNYLDCSYNSLTSLDVSKNTALECLYCDSNQLTTLDVSRNTALTNLDCCFNSLTSLDVSNNTVLETLNCHSNSLTSLDVSRNTALTDFYCNSNSYEIDLVGGTFDFSTLPDGFDAAKATGWINATVDGNTLTVFDPTQTVTYTYDLGNGSTETFALNPVSCTITEDMVSAIANQTYTGEAIEPSVTVMCGVAMLTLDTDYTISYENNLNTGTASATIKGTGTFYKGEVTVKFTIEKAVPEYTVPTGLTATYGDTLADITLPEGFAWQDEDKTAVGNAGINSFMVTFTPDDTANYEIVEDIEVTIEVEKAVPRVSPIVPDGEYTEGNALPEIDYEGVISGIIAWITELIGGLIEGENELEWQFTPDDTDNYEIVTGTEIVEAQATTTTTTTTTTSTTSSTTTTTTPPVATTVVTGDAENDSDVDTSDANRVLDYIDGLIAMFGSTVEEHEAIADAVDVDGDGVITKTDAALILGYAAQQGITWEELVSTIIPATDIDMTALNAKLAEAEAIVNDGTYTEESYAALLGVIEAVKATQNAENLPSGYAEQMTNLLTNAIDGLEENLPQTGYSVVYNYIMLAAAAMVLFAAFAMAQSRKRDEK